MVISVDAKKPFDEVEHLFMIKGLNREVTYLNTIKVICDKPTVN